MGPVTRSGITRAKGYAIALDVGGTFTDVALVHEASGRLWVTKTPTTPHDPSAGFMAGIDRALRLAGIEAAALRHVLHGTTTATNAILEGKGAAIGLLTTAGFRDVLEIGRHDIPRRANMFAWVKPARPVAPELIFEIGGRVTVDGAELEPLDEEAVRAAARRLRAAGVDSIAVCFLHSYANSAHERRARALLLEEHPGGAVSLSSEVLPVFREFERSMGTVLNAYVQPLVGRYVARLVGELRPRGIRAPLSIMKSNGGVIGADVVRTQAIHTALSGPAAGVIGARRIGEAAGFDDLISVDVGGTSADVCLVRGGEAEVTTEGRVGAWPLHVPMIDIHTIGAGGGSIARVTEDGTLTVGPESAGAQPGPVCYGAGGEEPTVTDAHLVLGRIPSHLLGGEIPLDVERARRAIEEHVARPLGLPLAAAAQGILDIVNNNMVGALRLVSVERGYDPRDFVLVPFGGAGPLHGADLAALLGMRTVVVPRHPGVLSTFGLLGTEVRNDYARTSLQKPPDYDLGAVARRVRRSRGPGAGLAGRGGGGPGRAPAHPHGRPPLSPPGLRAHRAVARARRSTWTRSSRASTPAIVSSTRTRSPTRRSRSSRCGWPRPGASGASRCPPCPAAARRRRVRRAGASTSRARAGPRARASTASAWAVGAVVTGPAIVEQLDTTTVIPPGHRARVDRVGNLVIQTTRSPSPLRGEGRVRGGSR